MTFGICRKTEDKLSQDKQGFAADFMDTQYLRHALEAKLRSEELDSEQEKRTVAHAAMVEVSTAEDMATLFARIAAMIQKDPETAALLAKAGHDIAQGMEDRLSTALGNDHANELGLLN
jgi:predicted methyltransferase MtxX (methanogen marker protein 4)